MLGIRRLLLLACVAIALSGTVAWSSNTQHPTPNTQPKLVVIVANRVCLADLDNPALPTVGRMLREGAVGLVSPNCIGAKSDYSVMLTASAGAGCKADSYLRDFYDANETVDGQLAADAYRVRTGFKAPSDSAVFLGLAQALRENDEAGLDVVPGACGDALRDAGIRTCAVGNADMLPDKLDRSAAVLAVDSRGLIDLGWLAVGPYNWDHSGPNTTMRITDPFFNVGRLEAMLLTALDRTDYVVVFFGDTVRLDEMKLSLSDEAYGLHHARILRDLDSMAAAVLASPEGRGTTLMLISLSPPADGVWDQLTPVVIYPSARAGLLTSATTRTQGLIAASDFAPTVAGLMGAQPHPSAVGRAARSVAAGSRMDALRELEARVAANKVLILPVMWVFALVGAVSLAVAAVVSAFPLRPSERVLTLLRGGLLAGACSPVAMLLAVLAPAGALGYSVGTAVSLVIAAALSLVVGGLVARRVRTAALPILVAYALTVAVIIVDAFAGGRLCKFALPSSYQLSGFRYYGIGNEYAGVLISTGALAAAFLPFGANCRKRLTVALGVLIVATLGVGSLGANYGGTLAAVVVFGLAWAAIARGGFGGRHVAMLVCAAVVLVLGFAYADWKIAGVAGTHAGRATGLAERLGQDYLLSLVSKKTLLSLSIIVSGTAQKAILAFLPFIVLWLYKVRGQISAMYESKPELIAAVKAVMVGAVFAFLFNDSGIVFAGIMLAMTAVFLLYSLMERKPCPES